MIEEFAKKHQLEKFRINQFNKAYYQDLFKSFDQMTTWSKDLREQLKKDVAFSTISKVKEQSSQKKDTIKVLFSRNSQPQQYFEAVLMKHQDGRNTVCVSSMVGCPLACSFCATGKMGHIANLTSREIVDQVLYFARLLKTAQKKVTNIVFMGMGEPLLNFSEVWGSIQILNDPLKFALSRRNITISTSGIIGGIKKLIDLHYKGRLAISLHAPSQTLRQQLMPVACDNHLTDLMKIVDLWMKVTNKRVSFEYLLIKDINDRDDHAERLGELLENKLVHVNLIPYNPTAHSTFQTSPKNQVSKFASILQKYKIPCSIRVSMGEDIQAACGQLATQF